MIKNHAKDKAGDRAPKWPEAVEQFGVYLLEQEKSPNTIRCYRQDLVKFGVWYQAEHLEAPELPTIAAAELRAWKAAMGEQAPQSVNRRLAAVQSLLKWAESRKWCQPVQRPRTVRQETPPPRWLSVKEQRALVRAVERCRIVRDIALIMLLLNAGLRIAEAASVRWTMLELSPRKGSVTLIGKGRKRRTVPLNVDVRNALLELASGCKIDSDRPVFEGREGGLTANALWRIVVHYGRQSNLDDLSPHVLRHTFCRRLAEQGVRLEEIAALAGHESIETTRRYVEPGVDDLRAAVERLAGGVAAD
jgi:site-specific recombinase XerD